MSRVFFVMLSACALLLTGCRNQDVYIGDDSAMSDHLRAVNAHSKMTHTAQVSPSSRPVVSRADYKYDDQKLSHEVLAALLSQDELKKSHIRVAGYHGDLLILGEVPSESSIILAQNIAASFDTVKSIQTDLVDGDNLPAGQRAADSLATTLVKTEIAKLDVPHAHLHIVTNNNKVYVVGPLSDKDKSQVQDQIMTMTNVDGVYFYY